MSTSMSKRTFLMAAGTFAAFGVSTHLLRRVAHAQQSKVAPVPVAARTSLPRTPSGDLGPFYPVEHSLDTDFDLTRLRGGGGARARGQIIEVSGRVLARDGAPQANARLEIWQANAVGRYAHPGDNRADVPLDPDFQGYAELQTDADGQFRILTVRPGSYPVEGLFRRSPHIHFDIRGRQRRLVTQMYLDDTDTQVLAQDKVLQHDMWGNTNPLPSTIFAKLLKERSTLDATGLRYQFDIVL
jgi:protocatechuate 3,4-dioxygenase beta subunit